MTSPIVDRDPGDERGERREGERRKEDRGVLARRRFYGRPPTRKASSDRRSASSPEPGERVADRLLEGGDPRDAWFVIRTMINLCENGYGEAAGRVGRSALSAVASHNLAEHRGPEPGERGEPREVDALREALTRAAQWFDEYAASHRAKGAHEKATRNQARADFCLAALRTPGEPERRYTLEEVAIKLEFYADQRTVEGDGGAAEVYRIAARWLRALREETPC